MDGNNNRKILTTAQQNIADEFVADYNFEYSQISFEGNSLEPIFDYEALNVLRLRLTDIQMTDPEVVERNTRLGIVTVKCTAVLTDGRSASDLGSAQFATFDENKNKLTDGEFMPDGSEIGNILNAQNLALSRALRRAIRSVGVNLFKSHQEYRRHGNVTVAEIDKEFQSPVGKELHQVATEWGHIRGKDKSEYQEFMARMFGGKTSSLELNDIEKSQFVTIYRNMIKSRFIVPQSERLAA